MATKQAIIEVNKISAVRIRKGGEYSWMYKDKNYRIIKGEKDCCYKLYRNMQWIGTVSSIRDGKIQSVADNGIF